MQRPWLAGGALIVASMNVAAQSPATPAGGARLGFVAGINLARLSGSDMANTGNKAGFDGGAFVAVPVTPNFDIQPELLYSAKGVQGTGEDIGASIRLNYLELPVLARINFTSSSSVTPQLYVGPAIAFRTGCTLTASAQGSTVSVDCAQLQSEQGDAVTFSRLDFGVVVGGGLSFDVGGRRATVGARYDAGLRNIASSGDAKNRTLSFLASFEMPMPGR